MPTLKGTIRKCHICCGPGQTDGANILECFRCGKYEATSDSFRFGKGDGFTARGIANASGWLRQNQGITLDGKVLEFLSSLATPTVAEKADLLLSYLSSRFPDVGQAFTVNIWTLDQLVNRSRTWNDSGAPNADFVDAARDLFPLLAAAWASDQREVEYLLMDYLFNYAFYLQKGPSDGSLEITPKGWERLNAIKHTIMRSDEAFVAMSFDQSMNRIWTEGLAPAIKAAGYKAVRIDRQEHLNKIDDEIVAAIRRAKFLVSDFTGQRGGVYFEAGFAIGLGKPVVWICTEEELSKVHFDTRQYNFLTWTLDKLPDLQRSLQNRIEATIGKGDFISSS